MDISDGKIWNEIKGYDRRLFFENGDDRPDPDELHLGLTMNFNGQMISCYRSIKS